jgi:hypothetical protein
MRTRQKRTGLHVSDLTHCRRRVCLERLDPNPGKFGPSGFTGLLCYEKSTGTASFYDTDGKGNITQLNTYTGWDTTWLGHCEL